MDTIGHIVTQGGLPCTLYNAAAQKRGGVLVPGSPVVFFPKYRDGKRAIDRTRRVADSLKGSLVDGWAALQPLLSGKPYEVVPVTRSHTGEPKPKPATVAKE
ncbi:MAG: hypothetical protein K0R17_3614 [Rariglobus sp.]|jgi:hypothetical protein|nr:hypothetical protein [Rariglobus sp.]